MNTLPTIVTMFYDIKKRETPKFKNNREITEYLDLSKQFILSLPYPLIIFIDEKDNDDIYQYIYSQRSNFKEITNIITLNLEDTYYFKYINNLIDLQKKFNIINGIIEHETPLYIILNNNKFDFIENAINKNPFHSTHFIWMDFGINHVAKDTDEIHKWILNIPNKIKQLCINPYIENVNEKDFFQYIYHHTAGGLFSGSSQNMLTYCELFKNKTEQIYKEDWYQIDEAVMTMVQRENTDLFDFFYGDYQGIISNYNTPLHNIDLILSGSNKCIVNNNSKFAYNILYYCIDYFVKNIDSPYIYTFINQHIIVDYYYNNHNLLLDIIYIINIKKNKMDNNILQLLNNNKNNLQFYQNTNLIIKK